MRANPYLITELETRNLQTGVFAWDKLVEYGEDLADKILGLSSRKVFASCSYCAQWPAELLLPERMRNIGLHMWQTLEVERCRAHILGHSRRDKLTVTFSDVASRYHGEDDLEFWAKKAENEGWPFDKDAVYARMKYKQTWTDVKKVRLVPRRPDDRVGRHYVELVLQGEHGEETVRIGRGFSLTNVPGDTSMRIFARDLSEQLRLRHATVNGCEEYAV